MLDNPQLMRYNSVMVELYVLWMSLRAGLQARRGVFLRQAGYVWARPVRALAAPLRKPQRHSRAAGSGRVASQFWLAFARGALRPARAPAPPCARACACVPRASSRVRAPVRRRVQAGGWRVCERALRRERAGSGGRVCASGSAGGRDLSACFQYLYYSHGSPLRDLCKGGRGRPGRAGASTVGRASRRPDWLRTRQGRGPGRTGLG